MSATPTVADMKRILDNALSMCEESGWDPADTPWSVGLISRAPVDPAILERGRQLAAQYGWTTPASERNEPS